MALKTFHLILILLAIVGADLFGGWAVHEFRVTGDLGTLLLGIACLAGGLGLAVCTIRFVRMMEQSKLR